MTYGVFFQTQLKASGLFQRALRQDRFFSRCTQDLDTLAWTVLLYEPVRQSFATALRRSATSLKSCFTSPLVVGPPPLPSPVTVFTTDFAVEITRTINRSHFRSGLQHVSDVSLFFFLRVGLAEAAFLKAPKKEVHLLRTRLGSMRELEILGGVQKNKFICRGRERQETLRETKNI